MPIKVTITVILLVGGSFAAATYTATSCNEYKNAAGTSGTFASPDPGSIMGTYATEQASMADGDIIVIPAGSCNWDTYWSFSPTNSLTFQGAGAKSATNGGGSTTGTDQTTITSTTSDGSFLKMTTSSAKTYRITGIAFARGSGSPTTNGAIEISGTSTSVRFDHNHLSSQATGYRIVFITGSVLGVADHNAIDQFSVNNPFAIENGRGWNGDAGGLGDASWADAAYWGSSKFFFVEDNWFNQNGTGGNYLNDCSVGGRQVIRHNTSVAQGAIQQHEMNGPNRGCREGEIYLNTFFNTSEAAVTVGPRSGTVLVWGNTIQQAKSIVNPSIDRVFNINGIFAPQGFSECGNGDTHNGFVGVVNTSGTAVTLVSGNSTWNSFGGTTIQFPNTSPASWPFESNPHIFINGTQYTVSTVTDATHLTLTSTAGNQSSVAYYVPSVWDGNTDNTGYPCLDMAGRGQGDLLTGVFSDGSRLNNATGTATWPRQVVDPVYAWNNTNTWPGDTGDAVVATALASNVVQANRDYYQQMATYCFGPSHNACGEWYSGCTLSSPGDTCAFRGSEGVGQGLLSARPSTCAAGLGGNTPGVGYWATDQNILYVCNPANTWSSYYTPYTYPHPLQAVTGASASTLQGITASGVTFR